MHQCRTISINTNHLFVRTFLGNSKGNHGSMSHTAHCHKDIVMMTVNLIALFIELPGNLAGSGDNRSILRQYLQDLTKHILTSHLITVFPEEGCCLFEGPLLHNERKLPIFLQNLCRLLQDDKKLFLRGILFYYMVWHSQCLEQFTGNLPLKNMLWLILNAGLPSPAYDEEDRDSINISVCKRRKGIDCIAYARVLHIYAGRPSGG